MELQRIFYEIVVTLHALGVTLGLGASMFAHAYSKVYFERKTLTQADTARFEFFHKFIIVGLGIILFSAGLIMVYYYFYSPQSFWNAKIYAKTIITLYLLYVSHTVCRTILPLFKEQVGKHIFDNKSSKVVSTFIFISSESMIAWLALFVLGSFRILNLNANGDFILLFAYMLCYLIPFAILILLAYFFSKIIEYTINIVNHD